MEPDTFIVWLLKRAHVWAGPGWECIMCGTPHQDMKTWPCCSPHDRGWSYEDFEFESYSGRIFTLAAEHVGPALDLWDMAGSWDKKFTTWQAQLKEACEVYEEWLDGVERELERAPAAKARIRDALASYLVAHAGKPPTAKELLAAQPGPCLLALKQAGLDRNQLHGVLELLRTDPDVIQAGTRRASPLWTLSERVLVEHGLADPPPPDEDALDEVKRELVKLANILTGETGRQSWTVKRFKTRFPEQVEALMERLAAGPHTGRDLGMLFMQFRDAFCVVGYGQNVAHWALQENAIEAAQHIHEDRFSKFTGGS